MTQLLGSELLAEKLPNHLLESLNRELDGVWRQVNHSFGLFVLFFFLLLVFFLFLLLLLPIFLQVVSVFPVFEMARVLWCLLIIFALAIVLFAIVSVLLLPVHFLVGILLELSIRKVLLEVLNLLGRMGWLGLFKLFFVLDFKLLLEDC